MAVPERNTDRRARMDRDVQADPDIRGVNKGRRDRCDDQRLANGNDPERVARLMNKGRKR